MGGLLSLHLEICSPIEVVGFAKTFVTVVGFVVFVAGVVVVGKEFLLVIPLGEVDSGSSVVVEVTLKKSSPVLFLMDG